MRATVLDEPPRTVERAVVAPWVRLVRPGSLDGVAWKCRCLLPAAYPTSRLQAGGGEGPARRARGEADVAEAMPLLRDVIAMHDVVLSPGACSETCASFVGRVDTTNAGEIYGLESEGENILVKVVPFAEARAMLERDEIGNAIGVLALQWLALHRDEVRARWT